MNNLPAGCTEEMVDAQCSPIAKGVEECDSCVLEFKVADMYPWRRYSWEHHMMIEVHLCEACVPRCRWIRTDSDIVKLELKPCGSIQSPTAQGPWCAEHELIADAESEE